MEYAKLVIVAFVAMCIIQGFMTSKAKRKEREKKLAQKRRADKRMMNLRF